MCIFINTLLGSDIKNSSWLNCLLLQKSRKNNNFHFLVNAYFCNTYYFLQNSSIFCFLPLFCRKTFPPWLYIFAFDVVNNPENSKLAIFSPLGRNNTQSLKKPKALSTLPQWHSYWVTSVEKKYFGGKCWLLSRIILKVIEDMVKSSKTLVKQEVLSTYDKAQWIYTNYVDTWSQDRLPMTLDRRGPTLDTMHCMKQ